MVENIFVNGEAQGKWKYWDDDGELEEIVIYEEGFPVGAETYDE